MCRSMFAAVVCLIAASPLRGQEVDRSRILEEFDIPTDGDGLLVPVIINNKRFTFLVDTGTSWTIFDAALRPLLQLPLKKKPVQTPLASVETEFHVSPKIQVGQMAVAADGMVACMALGDMRKVTGHEIDGVLGMDFLSQYVVRLDFDRGKLSFLKEADREAGMRLPFDHPRVPVVRLQLGGMRPLRFLIDTGSIGFDSGMLNSSLVSRLAEDDSMTVVGKAKATDASGTSWVRQGLVRRCVFAGDECTNTIWSETPDHFPNHVSLHFLAQYNVTFDFPNAAMYLTKSRYFGHADGVDLSGLHFRRVDGRVVVEAVDQGSPAEDCGVEAGDVIKSVGDKDASTTRLFVLRKALSQAGRCVLLVLQRGSETLQRELVLQSSAVSHKSETAGAPR
ncbi:MAG TPA: aspartyl protease family protein [Pirellulales bacterium]|nr:aspartyl protease family protein [Pirellulales bacterium]